ncbi:MAG TPA: glycosyltransferase family 9 protein [Rhodocyclaceae bacterium]|nr:glycosyltransferase family 9 protein [Rhodocyclaceae bacterium]
MSDIPQRILYINVSRIGDTLLATPAIKAVAHRFPQAQIDVLAHPKRYEVLEHLPYVHRVGGISKRSAFWKGRFGGQPYDLAFVCNFDAPLVEYALRVAKKVIAFRQADESLNRRLYQVVEPVATRSEHAVNIQLRLPAAFDIKPAGMALSYQVTPEEATWAEDFLRQSASGAHPLIGLQVASFPTKAYRDWPIQNFSELCTRILKQYPGAHFLIFGGSLEKDKTQALAKNLGAAATLCAGKLSLRQTAALMARLDLYIGVDTGPTHLMGALHRPMVALYHGDLPSWISKPLEHPALQVVDHPLAGQSCSPEEPMAAISVDQVWGVVQLALAGGNAAKE